MHTRSNSQKRLLDLSPSEQHTQPRNDNKKNKVSMATKADISEITKSISEFRKHYDTTTKEMRDEYKKVNDNITLLTTELIAARRDINELMTRVEKIEKDKESESKLASTESAKVNALEQRAIDTQLCISNVPPCVDTDKALAALSNWSNIKLDEMTINRAAIISSKNKRSSNLHIDFANINIKSRFMRYVKAKQKNELKKYMPILAEHIFVIPEDDTTRGLELNFRDQFTEVNKKIFNAAREKKDLFIAVWKSQGYIYCKSLPEDKPIRILSLDHLQELIKGKQNKPMDCDE
jgi:hypothetical protein